MGATNDIKESNITLKLVGLPCSQCSQHFTKQEINKENYDLWFDTTNDVDLISKLNNYYLTIRIRSIEHKGCPPIEERNYE